MPGGVLFFYLSEVKERIILLEEHINIVGNRIARIFHLLHSPVFAGAGGAEFKSAVAFTGYSVVNMMNPSHDFTGEIKGFFINNLYSAF